MSEENAITALHVQFGRLGEPLAPVADWLAEVLAELAAAERPETAWRRLRRIVLESLPPSDEVTGAFAGAGGHRSVTRDPGGSGTDSSAGTAAPIDWAGVRATARLLLHAVGDHGPSTEEIADLAAARLRAAPARAGFEPDPDLIVLDFPDGVPRAPEFQFHPDGALYPVVRTVNRMLGVTQSPWAAAAWWMSLHTALGKAPAEMVGRVGDDRLVQLARAVLVEV